MMNTVKILHIIQSLEIGGAEKLVFDIINSLEDGTFRSEVCCLDSVGILGERLKSSNIPVICMNRRQGIDWNLIKKLRQLLKKNHYDIIHAHQYTSFFYASIANGNSGRTDLIYTEHGRFYPDKINIKRYIFDPFLAKLATNIVSISEATKKAMVRYDNFPAHKIRVIYNGSIFRENNVDKTRKRESLNMQNTDYLITTAARLDPIKNLTMLIRVMEIILDKAPECKLIIMGEGPEYQNLQKRIEESELSASVFLLGHRDDVNEIFLASDLFLLSSYSEGTSMTLLEAMNAGLPVVATDVGGNPEIIHNNRTGYLVESDNDEEMAKKVMFLYKDRKLAEKIGMTGRDYVRKNFAFERMMNEYKEIYLKCVE